MPFTKLGTARHFERAKPFTGMRTKFKTISGIILLPIDIHRGLLFLEFFFSIQFHIDVSYCFFMLLPNPYPANVENMVSS